ncbi:MAG TPA: hypothetical protein VL727_18720 [Puia sp.]|nr:hypothetical protein [Puia sp.]
MKNILRDLLRRAVPHIVAILVFVVVAVVYCKPAFENKVLFQEDVLQWQGMARNSFQYKENHGHFPLWSNSMFSGMPAYQIAMDPQSVSIPELFYGVLTFFLTKPASFFFLACICFYFLALVLRVNPWIGIIGALAYAYATYNPVIVSVGHDTKMQAIALIPGVIGAVLLVCEKKYWTGMALTALFTGLMVQTQHMQIVYYTMIIAAGLLLSYSISWLRSRNVRELLRVVTIVLGAAIIGILSNAVVLFTTFDSSKETTRGGSELADAHGNYSNGLAEQSAFDFSMYKLEPLVMMVPNIYGGSTDIALLPANRSRAVRAMEKLPPELVKDIGEDGPRYYWGGVGELLSGPPYVGAIIILLALIGFFILDHRHKWWIMGVGLLTILMSWGGYFLPFNSFLLKYLPMYNKFRAPSMILVVPTFLFCMMAVLALQKIVQTEDRSVLWRPYKWSMLAMTGVFLLLGLLYFRFNYAGNWEAALLKKASVLGGEALTSMQVFVQGLRADRQTLFGESLLRSLALISTAALVIGLYIRGIRRSMRPMRPVYLVAIVGVLAFADVMNIDLKYLNSDNYQEKKDYQENFAMTDADRQVMADKDYFRVFDLRDSISNALSYGAMTAYFHNSIGGYHAAKLKSYEDLINHQLCNYPHCKGVINMLNTRYIIRHTRKGGDTVILNEGALGPAWFVRNVQFKPGAAEVMSSLSGIHPGDTAIVFSDDSARVAYDAVPKDTDGSIELVKNDNDDVIYLSETTDRRFAVFSEIFYKRGWRAWIDNQETPIIRTNYVLRGLSIPPGRHIVRFFFRPTSYYVGRQLQWMASIIFLMMLSGAVIVAVWQIKAMPWPEYPEPILQPA